MRRPEPESRERASSGREAPRETNLLTKRRRRRRRAPARRDAMLPQRRPQTRGRRPLAPPNVVPDVDSNDESHNKRQRLEQTASRSRFPLVVAHEARRIICFDDHGLAAARGWVAAKDATYGDVQDLCIDETGTWYIYNCVYGDSSSESAVLKGFRKGNAHAQRFVYEHSVAALRRKLDTSTRYVLVPLIDSEHDKAAGVVVAWARHLEEQLLNVEVDVDIIEHEDGSIGKSPHDKPEQRAPFQEINAPTPNVVALSKHRGKTMIFIDSIGFTLAKALGTGKVVKAAAHGFDITFQTLVLARCGGAVSQRPPVAFTKQIRDALTAPARVEINQTR